MGDIGKDSYESEISKAATASNPNVRPVGIAKACRQACRFHRATLVLLGERRFEALDKAAKI